jgi:hypothetical protein
MEFSVLSLQSSRISVNFRRNALNLAESIQVIFLISKKKNLHMIDKKGL